MKRRDLIKTLGVAASVLSSRLDQPIQQASAQKMKSGGHTLLVKNIHTFVTMDEQRREIRDGAISIRSNIIDAVETKADCDEKAPVSFL